MHGLYPTFTVCAEAFNVTNRLDIVQSPEKLLLASERETKFEKVDQDFGTVPVHQHTCWSRRDSPWE